MTFLISTRHFIASKSLLRLVDKKAHGIEKMLPSLNSELKQLTLYIQKKRLGDDGGCVVRLHLKLPHKTLNSESTSLKAYVAISRAFTILATEIKKYKSLHFSSQSEYPDKHSIRH